MDIKKRNQIVMAILGCITQIKESDHFKAGSAEDNVALLASVVGSFIGGKCLTIPSDERLVARQFYMTNNHLDVNEIISAVNEKHIIDVKVAEDVAFSTWYSCYRLVSGECSLDSIVKLTINSNAVSGKSREALLGLVNAG